MNESEINNIKIDLTESSNLYHLNKLYTILNYEIYSSGLFLLSFFGGIFLGIASLAAVLFTPYLTYILWIEGKRFWLITFYLMIIIPFLLSLIFLSNYLFYFSSFFLAMFYFYCFTLRLSVNNWIRERNLRRQLLLDQSQNKNDDELNF